MDGISSISRDFGAFLRRVRVENAEQRAARVPSVRLRPVEWRQLFSQVTPIPGESLRGLTCHACRSNHLPNSWGLLQYLGLSYRNRVIVAESLDIDPAELAYAIKVADHEVLSRRYNDLGNGHVSFFGLDLNIDRIEKRVRRFSPTALRAKSHHRAMWELRDIPFCLEGWDMLQEKCWCKTRGVVQGWTRTSSAIDECDDCGDQLARIEPFPVPEDMRPALAVLAALVDPSPEVRAEKIALLPDQIRGADRSRLFRLVIRMANGVDPDAANHSYEEPRERLRGLWAACRALMRWPTGIEELPWHEDVSPNAVRLVKNYWIGLSRLATPVSQPRRPARVERADVVGIRPATEIAHLSPGVLLAAWDHRLVTQHRRRHGARSMAAFDPVELIAFAASWSPRLAPDTVAHGYLGTSLHGVEQLVAIGELIADAPAIPGTGPHFRPETLDAYVAWFTDPDNWMSSKDTVRLIDVVKQIGGRPKPWGPILKLIRDGIIPFTIGPGERLTDRISIPSDSIRQVVATTFDRAEYEVPGIASPFSDRMVQRDAFELLNAGTNCKAAMLGIATSGRNPKTYAVADVERRAAEIIMIPEISAVTGLNAPITLQRLIREKVAPIRPGVWDRRVLG